MSDEFWTSRFQCPTDVEIFWLFFNVMFSTSNWRRFFRCLTSSTKFNVFSMLVQRRMPVGRQQKNCLLVGYISYPMTVIKLYRLFQRALWYSYTLLRTGKTINEAMLWILSKMQIYWGVTWSRGAERNNIKNILIELM